MTIPLFRQNAYLREASGTVTQITSEGGIILDQTVFFPKSGGQPGDSGILIWDGGRIEIATAIKGESEAIILVPAEPLALPAVGTNLSQSITWDRRHRMMRVHTALHLLSVVIPFPLSCCSIAPQKGRLDFTLLEAPKNKEVLNMTLNKLIACHFPVSDEWISESELSADPRLGKTILVQPPRRIGTVRMIRIGQGQNTADLQPCGGTHVANTSEIGKVRIRKIEKKSKRKFCVYLNVYD